MIRGINRQTIFEDNEDCVKFIETIQQSKEKGGFELYGYCLMGNHVHLLLREGREGISLSMQRICSSDNLADYVKMNDNSYVIIVRRGHIISEKSRS